MNQKADWADHLPAFLVGASLSVGAYGFLGGFGAIRMALILGLAFCAFFLWAMGKLSPIPNGRIGYLVLWLSLLAVTAFNSLRTTNYDLNRIDFIQIGLSVVAAFSTLIVLNPKRARLVLWYLAILCVPASLWITRSVFRVGGLGGYTDTYILGDDYLAPAHMQGYAVIAAFSLFVFVPSARVVTILMTVALASGLAFSMARGALLASLLLCGAIAVVAVWQSYWNSSTAMVGRRDAKIALVASIVAATAMIAQALMMEKMRNRLLGLFGGGLSAGGEREVYWSRAENSLDRIGVFGGGASSYPYYAGGTAQGHPHNILVGYWLDSGLPGLLLSLGILVTPLVLAVLAWVRDIEIRWLVLVWTSLVLFDIFEFMKSFNFYATLPLAIVGSCAVVVSSGAGREHMPLVAARAV